MNPLDLFELAYPTIRLAEGGFDDNPADRGGPTYSGVSLRAVVGLKGPAGELEFDFDHDGDVDIEDIKALKGHPEKIKAFYHDRYWQKGAHLLRWPICLVVMDSAVNHGPGAAARMLQRAVRARVDGIIGPETAELARQSETVWLVRALLVERADLYRQITANHPDQVTFFRGWIGRLLDIQAVAFRGRAS